ncbi:MAG TPA: nucleoside hydrolase-like domain-containing protein [Terracidiphilus sp.]|nr:nucleoside hydrolase-like domain-containing protein [Terracidiphilus sp.]
MERMPSVSFVSRRMLIAAAISVSLLVALVFNVDVAAAQSASKHQLPRLHKQRLIVLTDIGAEVDDTESMVRLVLYSDVIDIEGLIATTSTWKRTSVSPDLIHNVIDAYGKVHGNLLHHDPEYPTAAALRALVKRGRPEYGMSGVGKGKDSEGSLWIIRALEENDERPLWISVWGGVNTLAQALYTLRETRPADEVNRLISKLRVYTISDQDDSGPWIRKSFPELFYVVTPGGDYGAATWTGINSFVSGIDNTTISNKWLAEHIQQGRGPLGAAYPDVAYGMEGDTPSWLSLIPNGLSDPQHPDWGGWGGRYELYRSDVDVSDPHTFIGGVPIEPETRPIWTNAFDEFTPFVSGEYGRASHAGEKPIRDYKATIWRWRDDFQNDFAARMNWTTKPYKASNHPPVAILDMPEKFSVRSGEELNLKAHATDPDGDSLTFLWFQYFEAGSLKEKIKFAVAENMNNLSVLAPKVDHPQTVHFILRVADKGTPPIARYKRVIVTITP